MPSQPEHLRIPGADLGPYRIEAVRTEVAAGSCLDAMDTRLGRRVRVFCLAPDTSEGEHLLTIARVLATAVHPALAVVFDIDEIDGQTCVIQDTERGSPLAEAVASGLLRPETARHVVGRLSGALLETGPLPEYLLSTAQITLDHRGNPSFGYLPLTAAAAELSSATEDALVQRLVELLAELGGVAADGAVTADGETLTSLHAQLVTESPLQFAAPPRAPEAGHRLPGFAGALVGRAHELRQLERELRPGALVTITGPGGSGKTRLAVEAARRQHGGEWPGGQVFVDLAEAQSEAAVWGQLARSLEVSAGNPARVLAALSQERPSLLVLDNLEQVAAAARDLVSRLLAQQRHGILCTSRERLGLDREHVLVLGGLDGEAATALFRATAERARSAGSPSSDTAAIERIVDALDGMPLAIEIAATRTGLLSADELLQQLRERLHHLSTASSTGSARQRTLAATIAWSVSLLGEEERRSLLRLSVMRGPFLPATAAAVLDEREEQLARALDRLADQSLLQREDNAAGSCLRLLATVRDFAAEALAREQTEQTGELERRHLRHFAELADELAVGIPSIPRNSQLFGVHEANINAAFERALELRDIEDLVRLARSLTAFDLATSGRSPRLLQRLRDSLAVLEHLDAQAAPELPLHRARLQSRLALLLTDRADREEAIRLADAAIAGARPFGDTRALADAIDARGGLETDAERALALIDEHAQVAGRLDDAYVRIVSCGRRGSQLHRMGRGAEALDEMQRGVQMARELGNPYLLSVQLFALGLALAPLRPEEALEAFEEVIAIRREIGLRGMLDDALGASAIPLLGMGRAEEAARRAEEGLAIARQTHRYSSLVSNASVLGMSHLAAGDIDRAEERLHEARTVARRVADRLSLIRAELYDGHVHLARWDAIGALGCIDSALDDLRARRRIDLIRTGVLARAEAHSQRGDDEGATRDLDAARGMRGSASELLLVELVASRHHLRCGRPIEARAALEAAAAHGDAPQGQLVVAGVGCALESLHPSATPADRLREHLTVAARHREQPIALYDPRLHLLALVGLARAARNTEHADAEHWTRRARDWARRCRFAAGDADPLLAGGPGAAGWLPWS